MGGGGGPPPPTPVIVGALVMTFAAGLIDATTLLSAAATTSTHMSGKVLKVGVYTAVPSIKALAPSFCMVLAFFLGSVSAGVATATPKRKNLWTCSTMVLVVGVGYCLVAVCYLAGPGPDGERRRLAAAASAMTYEPWYETELIAPYLAAYFSGMQNGLLTTITGFMRTTHFTGTVTDVGLLLGQAYPTKMKDHAHWWKTRILSSCIGVWAFGGVIAQLLFEQIGVKLGFVAGGIALVVGAVGLFYLSMEAKKARKVQAEEAAEKERAKLARQKTETLKRQQTRLAAVTKITAFRLNAGMLSLQEMAKEMDANLESMPDPTAKVVMKAMNVHKFARSLTTKFGVGGATTEATESERLNVLGQIATLCDFMLSKPELVLELEAAHGAANGSDFLVSFSAQHKAFSEQDTAAIKVQAATRGRAARANLAAAK